MKFICPKCGGEGYSVPWTNLIRVEGLIWKRFFLKCDCRRCSSIDPFRSRFDVELTRAQVREFLKDEEERNRTPFGRVED